MRSHGSFSLLALSLVVFSLSTTAAFSAKLSPNFYNKTCPGALATIKSAVDAELMRQQRMGASLLRLFFHDCFVQTCDGSNLLDPAPNIDSEKNATPNAFSVRGYDVIDRIRLELDKTCGGPVVSCADIVAVAARDSVVALGGPTWEVELGRRDSLNGNSTLADINLPSPFMNLTQLIANFKNQGLDVQDLVALSGGHTIGLTHCGFFQNRIYNETSATIDPAFARLRKEHCPPTATLAAFAELAPLDSTPRQFDTNYFSNLVQKKGLLDSDQALYLGGVTDGLVKRYSTNREAFFKDFARSMVKMGNFKPLTGNEGQIRNNCRKVNPY
ncbi:hypothetical protein RHGRI_015631 [Rhododendron griersonianum]|uniref:Peroxidase n=1 Tax=Rhododendron griersonianum TaxID=479676 RepID=A0AAV6KE39_9ERIC|nr:hypothetical protein RHGRI_015631 [Rhododendron griersonianum]